MLWYKQLQENHPNLTLLRRIGHTYLLRDDNVSLEVFPQHSNLSIFDKENKENQGFYLLAKFQIQKTEDCKLAFLWVDYGCDSSFIVPKKSKIEDNLFKFRSQIDCSGRFSIPFLLGNLKSIVNTGVIVRKGVKLNPLESQAAFVRVQELENQMHNEKRKKKRL
ncbi:18030_t:CDS:2 [Entrophospora sp. SA101]|nr:18030_t:CDS:2 [Entrophospora sp. SA101]